MQIVAAFRVSRSSAKTVLAMSYRSTFMLKLGATCVALGLQSCFVTSVMAQGCGPYRVGLKEYPQVYARTHEGGQEPAYAGLDQDFYQELAAHSGCKLVSQLESQPRIWARMKGGSLDMTGWVIPTVERHSYVVVIPLLEVKPMAVTWADGGARTQEEFLSDPEQRVVVVRQTSYGEGYDVLLAHLRAQGRVDEVADFDSAVRVFMAKRVALLITYPWTLLNQSKKQFEMLNFADWMPSGAPSLSGLALSRRRVNEADQRRILAALRAMRSDGTLARIVEKYLPLGSFAYVPSIAPYRPGSPR